LLPNSPQLEFGSKVTSGWESRSVMSAGVDQLTALLADLL
jgi:hypothetical protein